MFLENIDIYLQFHMTVQLRRPISICVIYCSFLCDENRLVGECCSVDSSVLSWGEKMRDYASRSVPVQHAHTFRSCTSCNRMAERCFRSISNFLFSPLGTFERRLSNSFHHSVLLELPHTFVSTSVHE
jgi:hypothetical protein